MSFVHLRLHTEFSLVDSTLRIKQLMPAVEDAGMPAIAMTDQNNLFAMVKFYRAATDQGLKPIFGVDVLLQDEGDKSLQYHMILLCQNNQGYLNISKLISRAYQEGQTLGVPHVSREWVREYSDGVIALSGGKDGDIGYSLLAGNIEEAERRLAEWKTVFPDRYYLELQRTGRTGEERYLQAAVELAVRHDIPVVATNDVRFLTEEDFASHEARVCIHDGFTLADKGRKKKYSDQQYLKSAEEMKALFKDIPSAIENSVEIAKRCTVELTLGKNYLPEFPIPDGMTEAEYFCQTSREGMEERFKVMFDVNSEAFKEERKAYDERLQVELDVINNMGFPGYFLIVADFIQWAKDNDVPVGPGRGSGAGSLVAYALKITDIDPLKYDLLFERFLNPERVSMPDFDIDFCMDKREKVIDYVAETYGRDKVSQIITYGSMAAKAVVRDVGRVLGHPYGFVDRIAKLIPFEIKMTLTKALNESPDLKQLYDDEDVKSLIDLALSLEGLTRNVGKHAGGVLISPSSLVDFTPLYCEEGGGSLVSQFDKDDVEAVGLVKFDFLGLRNLTIIDWAVQIINDFRQAKGEEPLDISQIDLADEKSFELLRSAKTTAVFQLESRGMKELIQRLQPDVFEDIVALVALYRPGPLQSGMVDDFVNRKKGIAKVEYPHPDLEPVLNTTYGVIVYQEQVMQIAQILAGYSLGGADMLRRAMGKKKPEEMAKQRQIFMEGSGKRNIDADQATAIFDLMEKFAEYGFNKSHSAAYALVSFQTIWLKAHYPAAFMAAVLSSDMDNTEKVVTFIDECRQLGLEVIPPDVNRSGYRFSTENEGNVIFGLGAIKGAGESAIGVILAEREANGPFTSMVDVCKRVNSNKLSKRVLETLINAGVFDSLGKNRHSMQAHLPEVIRMASQLHRDEAIGQTDLFGGSMVVEEDEKLAPDLPEWPERERLRKEKDALGLYLTGHPINEYEAEISQMRTMKLSDLSEEDSTQKYQKHPVVLAGLVTAIRTQNTEKGKRAFVQLDDKTSYYEVFIFSNVFAEYEHLVVKEEVLIISGTLNTEYHTGNTRLRIEALYDIETARSIYARSLNLTVSEAQANNGFIDTLAEMIPPQGESECPIILNYSNAQASAQIRLGAKFKAPLDNASLESLRNYLGKDQVRVVY
ncbi:MAG: DNA polymerase III subunit alpha [Proteobacteria bacterium]|nr:MAG: DNA polymerase III subunit alpha [Pseudomonadota bacterium]